MRADGISRFLSRTFSTLNSEGQVCRLPKLRCRHLTQLVLQADMICGSGGVQTPKAHAFRALLHVGTMLRAASKRVGLVHDKVFSTLLCASCSQSAGVELVPHNRNRLLPL